MSFSDVVKYLSNNKITNQAGKNFSRMRIRDIITNPVYVKADAAIFEFFRGQGTEVVNDISQFIGTNGAYLYTGGKAEKRKSICLDGQVLVLAPHEGFIDTSSQASSLESATSGSGCGRRWPTEKRLWMLWKARDRAMVSEVFNFLCSAFVILCLAEIASLLFVSVHETFRKKREELRKFYRGKDAAERKQNCGKDTE